MLDDLDERPGVRDAVDRVLAAQRRPRVRRVVRHGVAKFIVFCLEAGIEPEDASMATVEGPYGDWLAERLAPGGVGAMKVYARKLIRELQA